MSKEAKHTPGPWILGYTKHGGELSVWPNEAQNGGEHYPVCKVAPPTFTTQYYLEQLKEHNPVEKDGVITFSINNQPIQLFSRTGWFTGVQVKQGFGIIELKKRIEQCQTSTKSTAQTSLLRNVSSNTKRARQSQ